MSNKDTYLFNIRDSEDFKNFEDNISFSQKKIKEMEKRKKSELNKKEMDEYIKECRESNIFDLNVEYNRMVKKEADKLNELNFDEYIERYNYIVEHYGMEFMRDVIRYLRGMEDEEECGRGDYIDNDPKELSVAKYCIDVSDVDQADVALICDRYGVDDFSGMLQQAVKKILLAGTRSGGKSEKQDIDEAIISLKRFQEING